MNYAMTLKIKFLVFYNGGKLHFSYNKLQLSLTVKCTAPLSTKFSEYC